jgi:hypothetical protein
MEELHHPTVGRLGAGRSLALLERAEASPHLHPESIPHFPFCGCPDHLVSSREYLPALASCISRYQLTWDELAS